MVLMPGFRQLNPYGSLFSPDSPVNVARLILSKAWLLAASPGAPLLHGGAQGRGPWC